MMKFLLLVCLCGQMFVFKHKLQLLFVSLCVFPGVFSLSRPEGRAHSSLKLILAPAHRYGRVSVLPLGGGFIPLTLTSALPPHHPPELDNEQREDAETTQKRQRAAAMNGQRDGGARLLKGDDQTA